MWFWGRCLKIREVCMDFEVIDQKQKHKRVSFSSGVPNTEKGMKERRRMWTVFIVSRC